MKKKCFFSSTLLSHLSPPPLSLSAVSAAATTLFATFRIENTQIHKKKDSKGGKTNKQNHLATLDARTNPSPSPPLPSPPLPRWNSTPSPGSSRSLCARATHP